MNQLFDNRFIHQNQSLLENFVWNKMVKFRGLS